MKNDQLLALSENLLEEKAKALKSSGEMKKQKGKTGQIVFSIIFAISLIGGLFAEIIHVNFVWFGQTMDFHEGENRRAEFIAVAGGSGPLEEAAIGFNG